LSCFWSVAQTQPLRERLAEKELLEAGFDVYFPRIRFRQNGRWRITGLFPAYVFFQFHDRWWSARWCRGVLRLLGPDGAPPARLPETVVSNIRRREKNGFVMLEPESKKLKKGQQVRIIGGRFDGRLAVFENQTKHERIHVLMEMLGAYATVELGEHDKVEPLQHIASSR
jgi:transcriptional antiterminator RfaH